MSQQVIDVETVGFNGNALGNFYDFYVSNTFYLLAPEYYYSFYSIYLNKALTLYDGWVSGYHNVRAGLIPQRMLQSVATGLNNMLFAHGIDFTGATADYDFAVKWAADTKLLSVLKKAHKFAIAGGTSLLKLNRQNGKLFATAHRIDNFFVDVDANDNVVSCRTFIDAIHNTNNVGEKTHFGICEERYFNEEGKPCVKAVCYKMGANLQTSTQTRTNVQSTRVYWDQLPKSIQRYVKNNFPSIVLDKEQYLPFPDDLGCYLIKFTDDIPQIPNLPFGQPIGDILATESFQYDQMKYFAKNEVDLARARALIPEEFWNKDDPAYDARGFSERFYQKVQSMNSDTDKVTPIQFQLRGNDMKVTMESIYKDAAFKLNVSASSLASFLSEGAGAKTATEIIGERTKSDTWISSQIALNSYPINCMLARVMRYYNHEPVQILFKSEDQVPHIETLKAYSDVYAVGNMSAKRFVKDTYKNLSQAEQQEEIKALEEAKALRKEMQQATTNAWQSNKNQ